MPLLKSWEALTLALVMHVENKTNDLQPRQLSLPFHDVFLCFFKYEISLKVQSTLRQSNVECVLIRESSDLMHGWNSPPYFKNKCWCPIDERIISCCIPFDWLFGQYLSLQVYCCIMQDHCWKPPSMYHHNSFTYVIFHLLDY